MESTSENLHSCIESTSENSCSSVVSTAQTPFRRGISHYKEMVVKLTESWQKIVQIDECRILMLSFVNFGIFRSSWQIFVNFSWRLQRGASQWGFHRGGGFERPAKMQASQEATSPPSESELGLGLLPTGFVSRFYGAPCWRIHRIMS